MFGAKVHVMYDPHADRPVGDAGECVTTITAGGRKLMKWALGLSPD
jgi:hypothetical protein